MFQTLLLLDAVLKVNSNAGICPVIYFTERPIVRLFYINHYESITILRWTILNFQKRARARDFNITILSPAVDRRPGEEQTAETAFWAPSPQSTVDRNRCDDDNGDALQAVRCDLSGRESMNERERDGEMKKCSIINAHIFILSRDQGRGECCGTNLRCRASFHCDKCGTK